MHILTVLCKGGWMPGNLSEGWRLLGCSVEEFFYGTHMGKSWSSQGLKENQEINTQLLATARRLKAEGRLDLIFAVIYDDVLDVETAKQLRKLDVPMVNYHVDMVGQWYRVLRTGKYFDLLACAQKDNWSALKSAGIKPYYLPMAANPHPLQNQPQETIPFAGVIYLGSPWLYRQQVLAQLAQTNIPLQIYGRNWLRKTSDPANAQPLGKNLHDIRYYLLPRLRQEGWQTSIATIRRRLKGSPPPGVLSTEIPSEYIKGSYANNDFIPLVQGAAINLGFTHFQGTPSTSEERRQVRLREFEIPMAGGFYLTQDCPELHELFSIDKHIVTWDKLSDLKEKISYYLEHPTERKKIAQAGQVHCLQNHTWVNRFRELLKELKIT
ncbi:MAG: glycosyltransferase [Cyanobacteria bacterium P01_A01_bin.84]